MKHAYLTVRIFAALAVLILPLGALAQVCPYGNGGGTGSGGGGATLLTITVDGNPADWGPVLANAGQVTFDGEWANCATSTDRDYVINPGPPRTCASRSIGGRDLAQFSWTFDSTNVYLYVKRFGSASNTQTFYFYMDTNSNQRMNTGEKVYQVQLSGSNRRTDGTLYNYAAIDGTNGDPLVAPAGSTYPGYADGYIIVGSITGGTVIYSNVTGGFSDGTGFEARIPWTSIGVPAATPIYFHVSSTNSSNPGQVPASIDDNLGGVNGQVGAFAFRLVNVAPDNTSAISPGNPATRDYFHTVTNAGNLADRYDLTAFSSLGLRVDLYDDDSNTLMATDANGDGDFTDPGDYCNPAYDSNTDGRPNTPLLGFNPAGTFVVRLRLTAPSGVQNVTDTTMLSAFSQGQSDLCASATDTTAIGDLTLTPTPQAKSVAAGQTVDYALTLGNCSLGDTFDLKAVSSLGWAVRLYTDPNGDGNPADGVLFATDLNGNGSYVDAGDSIAGGYDTNANGRPDFGVVPNTQIQTFVVRLTAPGGATVGTVDTCTVLAQGAAYGKSATAVLTSTVRLRLTFTPNYTVAANTNKYSGQGRSVFYPHTLINSWPASDTVALSSTSAPAGWTIRYWTDPDGDGNPSDGTQITGSFSLAANGGTLRLVVEVVIPSGLTLPLTHTATVTATGTAGSASVTDQVRVSYIATYADASYSLQRNVFALCQTVFASGSSLSPSATYTVRYINPAAVVIRSFTTTSDGNGDVFDQYTLASGDQRGTWTVELRNASNTLVDSAPVYIDPPPTNPSTILPLVTDQASYTVSGDNLSIAATYNNTSTGATYAGTTYTYLVRNSALTQYLKSDGAFAVYSGTETTRTTTPHTLPPSSSASETVTVNGVVFPSAGTYRVDVTWTGSCGFSIATATLYIPVGTALASYQDAGHIVPAEYFATGATVYLAGTNYLGSTNYTVAYYRPDGTLAFTYSVSSTAGGALSDSATVASLVTNGAWHAVVYQSTITPPPIYNPSDPSATSQDAFTVDTVAPSVTVNAITTTSASPALTGTVNDPTATVQVTVNGSTYTAVNNGDGTWTLPAATISPALAYGVYDVAATATDPAGNAGTDATTNELAVRYPAPAVTGPIVAGASSISGTSAAPAGTTITVYSNGVPIGTTTVQPGGTWMLTGVSGLLGGESITATAGTGAAISAPSAPVTVIGDSDGDGIFDDVEGAGDTDGDGHPDYLDLDSDNDGIADAVEFTVDTDGDGTMDFRDRDSDGDGVWDLIEGNDANHDGATDYPVIDANNDGIIDPATMTDADGDGWDDRYDPSQGGTPAVLPNTDGDSLPDWRDPDDDGDGIPTTAETAADYDSDGTPNYLDPDSDGDGILDAIEGAGDMADGGDGHPNFLDPDSDGDGLGDAVEGTGDIDGDGTPNYLDPDSDGDGIPDAAETLADFDNDGLPNAWDPDSDADGRLDAVEGTGDCDSDTFPNYLDPDACADADGDGIPDATETGDHDGDGVPDALDLDSDNDGIADAVEGSGDLDGDGIPNYLDLDTDGDGVYDLIEGNDAGHDGMTDYPITDANGDGRIDTITDGDGNGWDDHYDPSQGGAAAILQDTDDDGIPDWADPDDDGDGVPSLLEGAGDFDGDGTPNYLDLDSDGDGRDDAIEGTGDGDGDGDPNFLDPDAMPDGDNDGIPDATENAAPLRDFDGDGIPNYQDLDSDGDGIPDATEGSADADGDGSPNYLDLDSDGDGIPDSVELTADGDGDGVPNYLDVDSDGDGISDGTEKFSGPDGDGIPSYLDLDSDGDGLLDSVEGFADADHDGIPNYKDLDADNDGIPDASEGSGDLDGDGLPNYLDRDADGDGIVDTVEAGGVDANHDGVIDGYTDANGNGLADAAEAAPLPKPDADGVPGPDYLDVDSDGDGLSDRLEGFEPDIAPLGVDADRDGIDDAFDPSQGGTAPNLPDWDGDGTVDYRDPDDDNDIIASSVEVSDGALHGNDVDGDGSPNWTDLDADGDGVPDSVEGRTDSDGDGIPAYLDPYGIPNLLRNDDTASLAAYDPAAIFVKHPLDPSLDGRGGDTISQLGEGAAQQANGSSDDDDFYYYEVPDGYIDSDPTVLTDASRPLVFYQLSCPWGACTLRLSKEAGSVKVTYTLP